jgi:hypothetical protein
MPGVPAHRRNENHHLLTEHGRRLGHPGRVGAGTRDDVLDGDELEPSVRSRRVDQSLRLRHVHHKIVDQLLVEVVVAHRAGGGVRDAAGDDPVARAVHVPELVAGCLRCVDVVELGRHTTYLCQLGLTARGCVAGDRQQRQRRRDGDDDSLSHASSLLEV